MSVAEDKGEYSEHAAISSALKPSAHSALSFGFMLVKSNWRRVIACNKPIVSQQFEQKGSAQTGKLCSSKYNTVEIVFKQLPVKACFL